MLRLDKFITDCHAGSRSEAKSFIKKGFVTVDGVVIKEPEFKVSEKNQVCLNGNRLFYEEFVYYMLYKPAGFLSATEDAKQKTVMDLFRKNEIRNLFPVGRLDKDTEGLLIITNDGILAHQLTSPRYAVKKTYDAVLKNSLSDGAVLQLEQGVDIGEKRKTLPAEIQRIAENEVYITITEGKFHQVKRMFAAVGNEVLYLKRISMGSLRLDQSLEKGCYRKLTPEEVKILKNCK